MNSSLKGVARMNGYFDAINACFISVDIETTGPVPGLFSMYELGAYVVGNEEEGFMRETRLLSAGSFDRATLEAMRTGGVHTLLSRKDAVSPKRAMTEFAGWTSRVAGERMPVFVANNAPFDWMFVAWYFGRFGIKNPYGYAALDMKAYFMGMTGCDWKEATLGRMAQHAGITFMSLPHHALEDAKIQGEIFKRLLEMNGRKSK